MTPQQRTDVRINDLIGPKLSKLASTAPIVAGAGLVMSLVGLLISRETFFQSYLFAFMFWFGLTLGSQAWLMAHHVVGGGWGYLIRRQLEAATRCWPLIIVLWLGLVVALLFSAQNGHGALYDWADASIRESDRFLRLKAGYLNPTAWIIRGIICFAIWFGMAHLLNKYSRKEDAGFDPIVRHRLSLFSAAGLLVYLLTITVASMDWVMSIDPHWSSALFGAIFVVCQGHLTLTMSVLIIRYLASDTPIIKKVESRYFRDLGNLTLAFTLLWAYTNYSQFMIQYSANLKEEAGWQLDRTTFGWQFVGFGNIICHFALPFLFLLMSLTKVNIRNLAKLAMFLVCARALDLYFYIIPTFRKSPLDSLPGGHFPMAWLADLGLLLLFGGLWFTVWSRQMAKENAPIVPQFDPRLDGYWPLDNDHGHASHERAAHSTGKEVISHG